MSRAETRGMQDRLLARFVRDEIAPFHAHYRALFDREGIPPASIRSVSDLRRLPFTTKADLSPTAEEPDRPLSFLLKPDAESIRARAGVRRRLGLLATGAVRGAAAVRTALEAEYRPIFLTATTGRAAAPVSVLYASPDLARLGEAGRRLAGVLGFTTEDRGLNVFPYAPHLAFWQTVLAGWRAGIFLLPTGGGKVMGTQGILRAATRIQPTAIIGVPGYVHHLLRAARDAGVDLSQVRSVVLGAEKTTRPARETIRALLDEMGARDAGVHGTYGFTEARAAWGECPAGADTTGYHTYPDMEVFEIVDPATGETLPDEADGELVYTCLGGRGTVVLRYRTGDIVRGGIRWAPCPRCGRRVPRISSEIDRASNVKDLRLTKVKGTLVNLNAVADALAADPAVEEWQVEIRRAGGATAAVGLDEFVVRVALRSGREGDAVEARRRIKRDVFDAAEVTPTDVEIHPLDSMLERLGMETELKEKRFVDLR